MDKIIVTPRSLSQGSHPLLDRLRSAGYELVFPAPGAQPSKDQLMASIGDAVGFLAGVEKIDAEVLDCARRLKVISRNGTGVDNIDMAAAAALGIAVRRAEGANARGVAELAIAYMLAAARGLCAADSRLKAKNWVRGKGFELEGKTLGIIGCGRVGKLVARFAGAFDMKILAYDLFPDPSFKPPVDFAWVPLPAALARADIATLHCPPTSDGSPLLDRAAIAAMKKGVVVVNTAREGLVDPAAMKEALDSGQVRAYALDAFDKEPPDDWTMALHPGVIATPHIGGFTDESVDRAAEVAVENLLESLV